MSASQIANAANAQLSTGPRTEEGKRQSSQNARTHGLTAQHPVIPEEDRVAFDQLRAKLHAETKPQGALQQIIFEELVHSAWNLHRVRAMEAELNASAPDALLIDDPFLNADGPAAKLDRLARHHTRIERAFFRCLREPRSASDGRRAQPYTPSLFHEDSSAPRLAESDCKTNPIPRDKRPRFGGG